MRKAVSTYEGGDCSPMGYGVWSLRSTRRTGQPRPRTIQIQFQLSTVKDSLNKDNQTMMHPPTLGQCHSPQPSLLDSWRSYSFGVCRVLGRSCRSAELVQSCSVWLGAQHFLKKRRAMADLSPKSYLGALQAPGKVVQYGSVPRPPVQYNIWEGVVLGMQLVVGCCAAEEFIDRTKDSDPDWRKICLTRFILFFNTHYS